MREVVTTELEIEEKVIKTEKDGNNMQIKTEIKKEPQEDVDDSSEKILNIGNLVEGLKQMNIKPEEVSDDEDSDSKDSSLNSKKNYISRGPNGGKPAMYNFETGHKHLPMPPMPGNFVPQQNYMSYQEPIQKKGRCRDDEQNELPCYKYTRPIPDMHQQQYVPTHQQPEFGMQPAFCNNLNQSSEAAIQNVYHNPMGGYNFVSNTTVPPTMTQMRISGQTSGGKVTVQSPVSNMQAPFGSPVVNMADAFLEGLMSSDNGIGVGFGQNIPNNLSNQMPQSIQQTPNNDPYTGKVYNQRRCSDPDSGLESADERSPYAAQTPSPAGSTYTSPPSVDSGCGQSPTYEPFADKGYANTGITSPKYQGMQSPASYRATPSPANTSGYGSPLAPQIEEDLFDENRLNDLVDVLDVIKNDMGKHNDKNLRQSIECQQQEVNRMVHKTGPAQPPIPGMPLTTGNVQMVSRPPNVPLLAQPNISVQPGLPLQPGMPPQQGIAMPVAVPAMSNPQSNIIILPATSSQPIFVIPAVTTAPQQKKTAPRTLRPLLPKITTAPISTAGSSSAMTSTCFSNRTNVTMTTKVTQSTGGRTQTSPMTPKADRNLMIARRTVADIPREGLKKCDDEGDTYLHIAVCRTDKHMVQALLERLHREGLDNLIDQENHKRQTPLYLAVFINQPVMVAMFIQYNANVNSLAQNLSADGHTTEVKAAIHVAAAHGEDHLATLCELLKAKTLKINIVNNYGQTALHCAILAHGRAKRNSPDRINSIEIIKTLLKNGAEPTAQDKKSGKTPLMYAIEQRNLDLVEAILSHVEPEKVKDAVKMQAFDGSSCLKIAEGLKESYTVQIWNKLWNSLQSAATGTHQRIPIQQAF